MAALGAQSIASSYEQLLHVDADGGGNSTTHVSVKDGDNGTTFGFTIASDALMMSSTNRLEFGDTGTYIHQSADGVLDLVSDTEIEINATTVDMNGALDLDGTLTQDAGAVVFNEAGADYDFKIESDDEPNMFYVDAGTNAVGIGTSAPDLPGHNATVLNVSAGLTGDADRYPQLILSGNRGVGGNQHGTINFWNTSLGAGSEVECARFSAYNTAASATEGQFQFFTHDGSSLAKRMTIDQDGYVGIAMTPGGSHKLDVTGSAGLSTGTAWTNTSDERIKTNVETIENGLDKINQLRPVSFNYSEDYLEQHPEINASKKYNSFIAQEYADVFPDAVSIGGDLEKVIVEGVEAADGIEAVEEEKEILVEDVLQFTPHDLNMYLVAAVKELSAKVEALEG